MRKVKLLSAGYDLELLSLRNAILRQAGYEVTNAITHDQVLSLAPEVDGAILGNGIPSLDRAFLTAQLRELYPNLPIVVIHQTNEEDGGKSATVLINALDGPRALLDVLEHIFEAPLQRAIG